MALVLGSFSRIDCSTRGVDPVFFDQLLSLAAADIRFGFVIGDDQLDRPAVDAARFVDAVDGHLDAHHGRFADDRSGAGQRLHRADLVGLGLGEGDAPRRRQDRRAKGNRTPCRAPSQKPPACNPASAAERLGIRIVRHHSILPVRP